MEIVFSRLNSSDAWFILNSTTTAFANSLRRAMISEVPTLAIEDVRIYDNTSVFFDEMLTHRLGLIPLRTDLTAYVPINECSCGGSGCSQCTATYTLSMEGPCTVYSRDLIPEDPSSAPVDDNIPIIQLNENQKLVLEAKAVVNKGTVHAKWQPTIACGYKSYPVITIDERCDGCGMCVEECPRGILALDKGKVTVIQNRLELCLLCRLCERACLTGGIGTVPSIRIGNDESKKIFVVEGDGSLPVGEIIKYALLHLKKESEELLNCLTGISGGE